MKNSKNQEIQNSISSKKSFNPFSQNISSDFKAKQFSRKKEGMSQNYVQPFIAQLNSSQRLFDNSVFQRKQPSREMSSVNSRFDSYPDLSFDEQDTTRKTVQNKPQVSAFMISPPHQPHSLDEKEEDFEILDNKNSVKEGMIYFILKNGDCQESFQSLNSYPEEKFLCIYREASEKKRNEKELVKRFRIRLKEILKDQQLVRLVRKMSDKQLLNFYTAVVQEGSIKLKEDTESMKR